MVKYRLKKWYPSLPKNWEVGMEVVGEKIFANIKHKYTPYVFFDPSEITNNPEFWEKVEEKQPLFITEDGKGAFEGDKMFYVDIDETAYPYSWTPTQTTINKKQTFRGRKDRDLYLFSTREAAEKWIEENKPIYSKKDISKYMEELAKEIHDEAYCYKTILVRDINIFIMQKLNKFFYNDKA